MGNRPASSRVHGWCEWERSIFGTRRNFVLEHAKWISTRAILDLDADQAAETEVEEPAPTLASRPVEPRSSVVDIGGEADQAEGTCSVDCSWMSNSQGPCHQCLNSPCPGHGRRCRSEGGVVEVAGEEKGRDVTGDGGRRRGCTEAAQDVVPGWGIDVVAVVAGPTDWRVERSHTVNPAADPTGRRVCRSVVRGWMQNAWAAAVREKPMGCSHGVLAESTLDSSSATADSDWSMTLFVLGLAHCLWSSEVSAMTGSLLGSVHQVLA